MTADGVAPTGGMAYNFVVAGVAVSDDGRITDLRFNGMGCGGV
jgi:NifU-like protein involved in Fe-S cluster formation